MKLDWPPETPAMEVMGSNVTELEIISRLMEACEEHGFKPFHVKKSSNGYIFNRYVFNLTQFPAQNLYSTLEYGQRSSAKPFSLQLRESLLQLR